MQGILVFRSLADAVRAGYTVYERTAEGYKVETMTPHGKAFAVVVERGALR